MYVQCTKLYTLYYKYVTNTHKDNFRNTEKNLYFNENMYEKIFHREVINFNECSQQVLLNTYLRKM